MSRRNRNILIFTGILILALIVGLALDLRFKGLAWRVFYATTGEEEPFKQLYAFVGYLGNLTRRQPVTTSSTPISITVDNPLGINTFLDLEVEPEKRERSLQMIADAGFAWVRQQFRWDDIEINGRGNFTDDRNDLNGDGVKDAISAWDKYDSIVELAEKYNLKIIARLGSPPVWSQPADALPGYTPPTDPQDFANFAGMLADRYKGRVRFYQVWNEPNIYPEWGQQNVDPEAYTDMLCRAYRAIKAANSDAVVISGALAPTIELSGVNLDDLIYLQRMYDAGAGSCFDILGAQGYGLFSGPSDQRMRIVQLNFAHMLWLRDLMIANDDAEKPIWIGEMAWNPVPDSPDIADPTRFGRVTSEQAARNAVEAYERARSEWDFVGVISYWYFKRPSDVEKNQSFYYFRMVEPDFTPLPVYDALKAYAARTYGSGARP
ncbi:MAG: cellulase family glycosylhydrolase [Anaerolineae bacterium]|nr:cellulase family glycosylhydrolase [Anaerolineae bacterium]